MRYRLYIPGVSRYNPRKPSGCSHRGMRHRENTVGMIPLKSVIPGIGLLHFPQVCGQEGADATHCLDSCSGYEADLPEIDSFKYRYYTVRKIATARYRYVTSQGRSSRDPDSGDISVI